MSRLWGDLRPQAADIKPHTGHRVLLTTSLSAVTLWKVYHPDNHYFATENGRVTPIYPLNKPAWSMEDIAGFGADTLQRAFTMDFVHYRQQMTSVMTRFTNQDTPIITKR
jgi:intracellular multiplication protein IcmL